MYLLYIDESGDTISLSQGGKKFLVLTGCSIDERDKVEIEKEYREIKKNTTKTLMSKLNQIF